MNENDYDHLEKKHEEQELEEGLDDIIEDQSSPKQNKILPDLHEITDMLKTEDLNQTLSSSDEQICIIEVCGNEKHFIVDGKKVTLMQTEHNDDDDENIVEEKESDNEDGSINYECSLCCIVYGKKKDLHSHMYDDHKAIYCKLCDSFYKTLETFDEHVKHMHGNLIDVLPERGNNDDEMNDIPKETKPTHKCPHCSLDFVHKKNYENHLKRSHPITTTETEDMAILTKIDDENMPLSELLKKSKSDIQYKCHKCNAAFAKQKSLRCHQNSNKCQEESYPCPTCKRVFAKKKNLTQHMLLHEDKKEYKCKECSKEFTRQDQLTLHVQNHSGIKKHICAYCGKGFNMISTLKDHIRTHNGEKPYLCSICGKGFSQSTNLKQHMMRHNKTKPFQCNVCSYKFVSKGELDAHLRKHTGDHPFVCDVCGTGFTTSSSLVKHKRIHTGEKPYACEFCPMRFTALGTLKNHRRTHTGERPYACKYCERNFAQKSDMISHTRTHTGERPYVCKYCGLAFQHSNTLKSHYKTHQMELMNDTALQSGSDNIITAQTTISNLIPHEFSNPMV